MVWALNNETAWKSLVDECFIGLHKKKKNYNVYTPMIKELGPEKRQPNEEVKIQRIKHKNDSI